MAYLLQDAAGCAETRRYARWFADRPEAMWLLRKAHNERNTMTTHDIAERLRRYGLNDIVEFVERQADELERLRAQVMTREQIERVIAALDPSDAGAATVEAFLRAMLAASPAPAQQAGQAPAPAHQDYVLELLVAAGHITQSKVDEARQIAAKVAPEPLGDERAVFEAWYEGKPAQHMPACWNAWVARAALAATPSPAVAHGAAEPDHGAWQCDRCNGDGWHWTEEEGCEPRDKVNVKTHCEQCDGLGWLGPDATAAANHAKEKTNA